MAQAFRHLNIQNFSDTKVGNFLYSLNGKELLVSPTSISESGEELLNVEEFNQLFREQIILPYAKKANFDVMDKLFNMFPGFEERYNSYINSTTWSTYAPVKEILNHMFYQKYIATNEEHIVLYHAVEEIEKEMNISIHNLYYFDANDLKNEVGFQASTATGRFSKRFQKFMFNRFGIKVSPQTLTQLGNIYNMCLISSKTYVIRITNNLDWEDGHFGKDDSCWWGCYTESRDTLAANGGYGMLFYEKNTDTGNDDNGYGRMWILPVGENATVVFNMYGKDELKDGAAILARMLEIEYGVSFTYGKRSLYNTDDNIPYINGNNCYAIYKSSDPKPDDKFHLDLEVRDDLFRESHSNKCQCCSCGNWVDDDDSYNKDGEDYCSDCYHNKFFTCSCCGDVFNRGERHEFEDSASGFCDDCF